MVQGKFNNAILVVVYGRMVEDSLSYSALINCAELYSDLALVFWNNGPKSVVFNSELSNVFFMETINNEKLSYIYNSFIDRWPSESYMLLDDDSILDNSFLDRAIHTSCDVAVGVILDDGIPCYPLVDGVITDLSQQYFLRDVSLMSIGSGLIMKRSIIDKLSSIFDKVFDEKFNIYGVDTSFFLRLQMIDPEDFKFEVIPSIVHSLSKNKTESVAAMQFRIRERSRDIALTLIHYNSEVNSLKILLSVFLNSFLAMLGMRKRLYSIRLLIKFLFDRKAREFSE
jgi:hypothetical protein